MSPPQEPLHANGGLGRRESQGSVSSAGSLDLVSHCRPRPKGHSGFKKSAPVLSLKKPTFTKPDKRMCRRHGATAPGCVGTRLAPRGVRLER